MSVSIIIPAYNAELTLPQTLASVKSQSHPGWEAVVVDDGSTDRTRAAAEAWAGGDERIRVVTQPNSGEGAARNAGMGAARFEWLLFLDADDRIAPAYLQRMMEAVAADPALDAVHCGWIVVDPAGRVFGEDGCRHAGDMFPIFANRNAFPIHACVVRRALVERAGRFDPSLRTCADWDLWQRVARLGARFGRVPDRLAHYCLRPYATWTCDPRFFFDGCRVIERGHAPDPRVATPHPSHATGMPRERLATDRLYFACFCAGMEVARHGDAAGLLEALADDRDPDLEPHQVSAELFSSAVLPGCLPTSEWDGLWPKLQAGIADFLAALEAQSQAEGLAQRTRTSLERRVLQFARAAPRPVAIGHTLGVDIQLADPMGDIVAPPEVSRVLADVRAGDEHVGTLELPVCDGLVHGDVLADAIVAAEMAWPILGRFFEATIYPGLRQGPGEDGVSVWRGSVCLAESLSEEERRAPAKMHDRIGWTVFLQELWGRPEWELGRFYDPHAREETEVRWVRDDVTTVEVAAELNDIAVSRRALDVEFLLGGVPVALLTLPVERGRVSAQQLRVALTNELGFELCRAAVREGLVGAPLAGPLTLRDRLAAAAKVDEPAAHPRVACPPPGEKLSPSWARAVERSFPNDASGLLLGRHSGSASAPSVSRRASLPMDCATDLLAAARVSGQPVIEVGGQGRREIRYAPDLLWRSCQQAFRDPSAGKGRTSPSAAIVRIAKRIGNTRSAATPSAAPQVTRQLPILMYHQVAPAGPGYLSRYRVTPRAFEEQLRYLQDEGFRSTTLEEWRRAMQAHRPIPSRTVLLTFDDGFLDFRTHAWPLLRRFGFSAIVFVVAERVGTANVWDQARGEPVPLLGWQDILHLRDEGVAFGSHSATHAYLTCLSAADVVREAVRSRAILERELRRPVEAFAYPHGDEDRIVQHLIGACGYVFGLSTRPGLSSFNDPLLSLPRVEITGAEGLSEFASKLSDG